MGKPRLTMDQKGVLYKAATGGTIYPHLTKRTMPSLIKRGLIVQIADPHLVSPAYKLTEDGLAIYLALREVEYQRDLEKLHTTYNVNVQTAKNRTV